MIRLVQRTLIIPRGDTGYFTIPQYAAANQNNKAIFTIFDPKTHTKIFEKQVDTDQELLNISFTHFDTVNLPVGKYKWDIKYYDNPTIVDEKVVDGVEVNSYYSAFSLPDCEIRETGDNLLTADDAPISTLTPSQLNVVNKLITELRETLAQTHTNVSHYPKIVEGYWYVWDATSSQFVNTNVSAEPIMDEYVKYEELTSLSQEDITDVIGE